MSMFLRSFLFIIVSLIIMLVLSWPLSLVTFGGVIPLVIFSQFFAKWMRTQQVLIQKVKGEMSIVAEESFSNIRTVKAFSNEMIELERFRKGNELVYLAGRKKAMFQSIFSFFTSAMTFGSMAICIYVASILFKDGDITIGTIASFMYYMLALNWNFIVAGMVFGNVASVVGASDKIVQLM